MSGKDEIDFVVTWVNGNDPEWQKEKTYWLKAEHQTDKNNDAGETRYRDWDNLRYWFRAVEKYAPWVNRVHLITCGHIPEWLNTEAPKLNLVRHEDYIPQDQLPAFSSHPIELHMHRIKGLAEHFVYFNDDMFLTAPVEPEDFFVNGLPCDYLEETPYCFSYRTPMNSVYANNMVMINQNFERKKSLKQLKSKIYSPCDPKGMAKNLFFSLLKERQFFGFRIPHLPQAYLKETFEELWEAEWETLWETCSHKFRNADDVSPYVFRFWQLLQGRFEPYNMRKYGKKYNAATELDRFCDHILNQKKKTACLLEAQNVDFESTKKRINETFGTVLPNKSSFEL